MLWNLTGTDSQRAIVQEAFVRLKFPFDRLSLPGTPELGWRDLNGDDEWWMAKARMHGDNHHDGEKPESLEGEVNGRRFTLGVFFPSSARIFIDSSLEQHPEIAKSVVGAELAHAVDEFLPLQPHQREEFLKRWNVPNTTWWEVADYGEEYYRLGGEAFMHEFVQAYSDLQFGDKSAFAHDVGIEPKDVWDILGIERTDAPVPLPEPGSVAPPIVEGRVHFPKAKSKIFHSPRHYPRKAGVALDDPAGYRACKLCTKKYLS